MTQKHSQHDINCAILELVENLATELCEQRLRTRPRQIREGITLLRLWIDESGARTLPALNRTAMPSDAELGRRTGAPDATDAESYVMCDVCGGMFESEDEKENHKAVWHKPWTRTLPSPDNNVFGILQGPPTSDRLYIQQQAERHFADRIAAEQAEKAAAAEKAAYDVGEKVVEDYFASKGLMCHIKGCGELGEWRGYAFPLRPGMIQEGFKVPLCDRHHAEIDSVLTPMFRVMPRT